MLAQHAGKEFDEGGKIAETGTIQQGLLHELNRLDYYNEHYPKSLSNDFGTEVVYPLIQSFNLNTEDALRTYVEHIAVQIKRSVEKSNLKPQTSNFKLLATGGGAFNNFLVHHLQENLKTSHIDVIIPEADVIMYKEALIMALLGVLRWREENTVMASVTGARRSSIGGAVWIGQEA